MYTRKRGRPSNPYASSSRDWKPGGTREWEGDPADLEPKLAPASYRTNDPWTVVYPTLLLLGVPVLRRALEAILVFEYGLRPDTVTDALDRLTNEDDELGRAITVTTFKHGSEVNYIYCHKRKPTTAELHYLRTLYRKRSEVLTKNTLKVAGERYFRGLLIHSRSYEDITQQSRLGNIRDKNGRNALDMLATHKASKVRYGISVKNQREWLYPGNRVISDCYAKAAAHHVRPWLVVPFAVEEAIARCKHDKITLTTLNRQIVPAETKQRRPMRVVLDSLRSVIGPQPFEYLYSRFSRVLSSSPSARKDLNILLGR